MSCKEIENIFKWFLKVVFCWKYIIFIFMQILLQASILLFQWSFIEIIILGRINLN